jgi:hypothetical protein
LHCSIIRRRDVLDPQLVAHLWTAVPDSEVVDAHEDEAARYVVRRLAVSGVARKLHVEVAA